MTIEWWDGIYRDADSAKLGWFETVPATLDSILTATSPNASVIDVGAGASTLVDHLLDAGYHDLTLVDISSAGLEETKRRLGSRAEQVVFVVGDLRTLALPRQYDLWHDRAVYHFLVDADDREAYLATLDRSLGAEGTVVISTFAPDGPKQCAGQPVAHYDERTLAAEFADILECTGCRQAVPGSAGSDQRPYVICTFKRPRG